MSDEINKNREATNWAKPVDHLQVSGVPSSGINLNVQGKHLSGPLNGFGQLWQKTYRVALTGQKVEPIRLISEWKAHFPSFWPKGNNFYGKLGGINPGDVAVLNLAGPANSSISTGIIVIYADDESFTFMTPQGHIFAGMITFTGYEEDGTTFAQIQALIRASDPLFEIAARLGVVHKQEDIFWHGTLANLARHFGVTSPNVTQKDTLVDSRVQWGEAGNVWHNSAIRTGLNLPVRLAQRIFGQTV
jgi:hypothetical protein